MGVVECDNFAEVRFRGRFDCDEEDDARERFG